MKKIKKLLLGLVTFAAMAVLCAVCVGAEKYGDYEYSVLADGTVEITDYSGSAATLNIPVKIDGKSVTGIGEYAFEDCISLKSVIISDGVEYIFGSAFSGCSSLENVKIPESVENIYSHAFYNCTSLKEVTLPETVKYIYEQAFGFYQTYDYENDWYNDEKIPGFKINYTKNTAGHLYATRNGFSDEECIITSIEKDEITEEVYAKMVGYAGKADSFVIPAIIDGTPVLYIGDDAFSNCITLKNVTIPDGIREIGNNAFANCTSLTEITIPDSVYKINNDAFTNCISLKEITIPETVTEIGYRAFGYTDNYDYENRKYIKIDNFTIHYVKNTYGHLYAVENGFTDGYCLVTEEYDGKLSIKQYAGNNTSFEIPATIDGKSVTRINYGAFSYCTNLVSVIIPNSIVDIESSAFEGCSSLTAVNIPENVETIGYNAFFGCKNLKNVTIPAEVNYIGDYAFGYYYTGEYDDNYDQIIERTPDFSINYTKNTLGHYYATANGFSDEECLLFSDYNDTVSIFGYAGNVKKYSVPSIINGNPVTEITYGAFKYCSSLEEITIPESVTDIGYYAVGYIYKGGEYVKQSDFKVNYTKDSAAHLYAARNGFTDEACFFTKELDNGTLTVEGYYSNDISFTIPSTVNGKVVTEINERAFKDCSQLTELIIPDSIVRIGDDAFIGTNLYSNSNEQDKYIGKWFLFSNETLNDFSLKNGTVGIADSGFYDQFLLESVSIPDSVKYIGENAFMSCYQLSNINLPDSVEKIGDFAFYYCTSLEHLAIPGKVEKIGDFTFGRCNKLNKIEILDGITDIGECAFYDCDSLKEVTIPASVKNIGEHAFGYYNGYIDGILKIDNFKIFCYSGTAGETYAKENGFEYVLLDAKPTAVTGFTLGGRASNALRLNWTKNTSADGYIIEQYKSGKWVRIAKITSNATTIYRVTGLSAGTAYKFRMKAYKTNGSTALYSGYTATLSARTNPSAVTGLKLGGRASNALRLNWNKNTSADGYIIEQYKSGKWVRIAKIAGNATTTYRVSGLSAGTAYKFRMKAYKMSGSTALYSGYTATLAARTNPSNVTGVKIGGKASTALRLNWTKNTSADGYIVEFYKGGKWVRAAKITKNTTVTYRISGLAKNTTYKIRIKAYKMSGTTALYSGYTTIFGKTTV